MAKFNEKLGVSATTCVKPSGTVSQLVNSASGIHTRHSRWYARTVRADNKDPLTQFLKEQGVKWEPCVMKPGTTTIFTFPIEAPTGAIFDTSAVDQLSLWLTYQRYWCEHKPSVTISVAESEWPEVGAWVWEHFDEISGVSFLPKTDHVYKQAPYQAIDLGTFEELVEETPFYIDWSALSEYEKEDNTSGSQTLACSADSCEVVDIG